MTKSDVRLKVVVPTLSLTRANAFLGMLDCGSRLPNSVEIMTSNIDVSQCLGQSRKINKRVWVTINEDVEGVNPWWNRAIECAVNHNDCDVLLIMNDDVLVSEFYIEKMLQATPYLAHHGIIVPRVTSAEGRFMRFIEDTECKLVPRTKRCGCAFMLDKKFISMAPSIPKTLKFFYGDDWLWFWAEKLLYTPAENQSTLIYHEVGGTTRTDVDRFRMIRKAEGKVYRELVNNNK